MPVEDRAGEANGTESGTLDEVTLRALIEHIPVTVYIDRLDETGSNVYTSPQLEAELGYTVEEWVSDKDLYAKVLHPDDRDWVLAEYARRRVSDVPFRAEYRMIARDGAVHWYHDEATVIRDETGRPAYFHGFLLDITEQKQLAEALRGSEQELRRQKQYIESLVEINPTAIVTVDRDSSVTSWNLAAEDLFGYSRDEAIGRKLDDLVAREDLHAAAVSYEEVLRAGRFHAVTQRARRDGTLADVELIAVPVIEEGEPTAYLVIYHDISELQRQKRYFESLLEVSPSAIVTVDPVHRVTSWNPAAEKLFGYSREEAIGQDVDLLVASAAAVHHEAVQVNRQTFEAGQVHLTTRRTRKDGSLVDVDLLAAPIRVGDEMVGLYALYHDISDLQRAREQAEAATQAKSAFLAMMSHEIRTPLNAVIGMTGLLLDTALTPEQRNHAEVIHSSGGALMAVIADILDFSKIEAGRLELESWPFDLRNCVESALELVAASASSKRLELAYFMAPGMPRVIVGDSTRLRQIMVNLLNNAVKFTDTGEVVLSVDGEALSSGDAGGKHRLHFAIRDTGIGIAEDRLSRLFESFSQLDASTTRRYGGTGLGLAISKRLAELMGGTIWVESRVGEGSTFHFTIEAEEAPAPAPAHERGAPPQLRGRRVLIVDDNPTNRHILRRQAESWGMLARETAYPAQAVEWISQGDPFDLAILDMQMPDIDGVTLAAEIRRFRDARSLPLVMLTSLGSREHVPGSVELAACLTKPVKPSQLYDTLMSVFGTAPAQVQAPGPRERRDGRLAERLPLRILVAEDNVVNQQLAVLLLKKIGYRADVAANGLEVLEALERETYDVVIMDVQMPEMDGLEATRRIHQRWPAGRRPHIIAATANAMPEEREACLAAGMDAYLSKPIRVEYLATALSNCRPHAPRTPPAPASEPGVSPQQEPEPQGRAFLAGVLDSAALERLVKIIGDDPDLLAALIATFHEDVQRLVDSARRGLQQGQADEVRRAAHTLKSTGAAFGATRFSELSRTLESLAGTGTLGGAADLIPRIEAEYLRVGIALETVRERGMR